MTKSDQTGMIVFVLCIYSVEGKYLSLTEMHGVRFWMWLQILLELLNLSGPQVSVWARSDSALWVAAGLKEHTLCKRSWHPSPDRD